MRPPVMNRNAVAVGIGTRQDHSRAMEGKSISTVTACLLIGFAVLCGLDSTEGLPSFDPPQPYTAGLKRAVDPASLDSDDAFDASPADMPAAAPAGTPPLNPLLPFIKKPLIDPGQFIQMKADLLKNLFGPGGIKGPVTRAVTATKWAAGKSAWGAAGSAQPAAPTAPASKWASPKTKTKTPSAPAPTPAQPNYWQPPAEPAPAPGYWVPSAPASMFPAPGYWVPANPTSAEDRKTVLLEALLDQYLAPAASPAFAPAPASRVARAPMADPATANPTPSPYLSDLLDSLNLTLPAPPPTLKPTIEPPGFWFPSLVPAPPGSLTPFVVDPTAMVAKKSKFLSDLFASKAAANAAALAALSAPTASSLSARSVDPDDFNNKVATYLGNVLDSAVNAKRAVPAPKPSAPKSPAPKKSSKTKTPKAKPTNPPIVEAEEVPEDEIGLDQLLAGLRRKREVEDDPAEDGPTVAEKSAALLNDMAILKQNILLQLDAMSKAESAASKATKLAAKAAKKAATIAGILNMPPPSPPTVTSAPLADYQQKIATLTNLYNTLSTTQKNITSAPDANDPFNSDKLFIAAVNAKMAKILTKNALLTTIAPASAAAPKVARSYNWQRHHEQDSDNAPQYEFQPSANEAPRPQKAGPVVAAVFAPQAYHFKGEPNQWN